MLLANVTAITQNYSNKISEFMDMTLIDSIVKDLENQGFDTIIVYQGAIHNQNALNCSSLDSLMNMSYIIWANDLNTYVIPVSECAIYKKWIIPGDQILNFVHLDSIWIRKSEEPEYLLDNLRMPYLEQIVYFYSKNTIRVMELGSNSEYILNPNLEEYRSEFLDILNEILQLNERDYLIQNNYNRFKNYLK